MTIFSYNSIQLGLYGGIGYYLDELFKHSFDISLPWYIYSLVAMAACLWLGLRRLHAGAMVLATLLTLETLIILALDLGIIFSPATPALSTYTFEPFSIKATFSGAVGVALMFAHASFIGFEGTAIYGEEAKPQKNNTYCNLYCSNFYGRILLIVGMAVNQCYGTECCCYCSIRVREPDFRRKP
ncbi:hypothetical protein LNP02_28485 [Klebsiella variicola subsp. variicola]|nr:hypothetical protein [Klebsiella variicola subsp. variicola]